MTAIIASLLHHREVFYQRGSSYRMGSKRAVALSFAVAVEHSHHAVESNVKH